MAVVLYGNVIVLKVIADHASRKKGNRTMRPIIEPYSPVTPPRSERRKQQVVWPVAALLTTFGTIMFLIWLGGYIVASFQRGNPALLDVYGKIVNAIAGGQ